MDVAAPLVTGIVIALVISGAFMAVGWIRETILDAWNSLPLPVKLIFSFVLMLLFFWIAGVFS